MQPAFIMEMAGFHSLPGSDGDSTDRQQDEDGSSAGWVVLPTSPLKQRWNVLILLCIVYSAVMVPVRIGFHTEAHGYVWDLEVLISLIFVADVVLTFHTSLIDAHGGWVMDRSSIASSYVRGWFWIDAPSSVPVELIALVVPQNDNLQLLRHSEHKKREFSADGIYRRLVSVIKFAILTSVRAVSSGCKPKSGGYSCLESRETKTLDTLVARLSARSGEVSSER